MSKPPPSSSLEQTDNLPKARQLSCKDLGVLPLIRAGFTGL